MKKSSRILAIIFAMLFVAIVFVGCGGSDNYEKKLIGSWYIKEEDLPVFTFHSDGTCEVGGDYEGKWSVINEDQLELTVDGQSVVLTIASIEDGCLKITNGEVSVQMWNSPQA